MGPVLVIVDMQPTFPAANYRPVIEAVEREAILARKEGRPVIVLEYMRGRHATTHASIMDILEGPVPYPDLEVVEKTRWSGADIIVEVCRRRGWDLSSILLCGVETTCCVADTAEELTRLSPGTLINVVEDACNDKVIGWHLFPKHENIRSFQREAA